MSRRDTRGAEALLAVMMVSLNALAERSRLTRQQHGVRPAEEQLNRVIRYDAQEGRTEEISRLIGSFAAREFCKVRKRLNLTSQSAGRYQPFTTTRS